MIDMMVLEFKLGLDKESVFVKNNISYPLLKDEYASKFTDILINTLEIWWKW